jgi:hypothetical protein
MDEDEWRHRKSCALPGQPAGDCLSAFTLGRCIFGNFPSKWFEICSRQPVQLIVRCVVVLFWAGVMPKLKRKQ